MSQLQRNMMQMRFAKVLARRHGISDLEALDMVKIPFAAMYGGFGFTK